MHSAIKTEVKNRLTYLRVLLYNTVLPSYDIPIETTFIIIQSVTIQSNIGLSQIVKIYFLITFFGYYLEEKSGFDINNKL